MTRFTVEPLPLRPNLEHQQKLAKRLLRDCWAGDADAIARVRAFLPGSPDPDALKLHDAQVVIARGYGFDSWAAMKRKIDSLSKSPLERFDIAVREGDAELASELLERHPDVRWYQRATRAASHTRFTRTAVVAAHGLSRLLCKGRVWRIVWPSETFILRGPHLRNPTVDSCPA